MESAANISRFTRDGALSASIALPAAGASAVTPTIDLGNPPGRLVDNFDVVIEVPATPSLADAHTITLTLQDSADGVTFAAIAIFAPLVMTGAGGVGAAALTQRLKLPETTRQYINVSAAVAAAGGNNTAQAVSLSLLF